MKAAIILTNKIFTSAPVAQTAAAKKADKWFARDAPPTISVRAERRRIALDVASIDFVTEEADGARVFVTNGKCFNVAESFDEVTRAIGKAKAGFDALERWEFRRQASEDRKEAQ